jgi:hypothetical protein
MPSTRPTLGVSVWPDFDYDASGVGVGFEFRAGLGVKVYIFSFRVYGSIPKAEG